MHLQKNLIVLSALFGLPAVLCLRPNTPAVFADASSQTLTKAPAPLSPVPVNLSQTDLVKGLLENASEDSARNFLTRLTLFPDRFYKSKNGIDAAKWIQDQVIALNSSVDPNVKLTVRLFEHSWKMQPSVIARLESAIPTPNTDIVITGTHLDTIGYGSFRPEPNRNPAADDCASGSTVVFESLRVLVEGKMVPVRPIEFHWYAAEEEGIYGSGEVSEAYARQQINVMTYLNLDQSGYIKPGTTPTVAVMTDGMARSSTQFLTKVVDALSSEQRGLSSCGYPCTDNFPWYNRGYPTAGLFESLSKNAFPYNDRVKLDGSPLDTIEVITFSHLMEFVKVTVGFLVELSLA